MTNRPILSAEEEREVAASERIIAAVHTYLVEMEETEEGGEEIEIRQFEAMKAAIAVADRARDQRAEREDGDSRPRPEAASPVANGEASGRDAAHLEWAVARWNAEVANRPLQNVHRRALDTTWRQMIRRFGGNPDVLVGPSHDALFGASSE